MKVKKNSRKEAIEKDKINELQRSEERYRTIIENIEEGYYEVDLSGKFTFINKALCKIFGYKEKELIGMRNLQYMDKQHAKKLYHVFNDIYKSGKPAKTSDWEIIRKDGTKRYLDASVSLILNSEKEPVGFQGIARDITKRMQAENALRLSEEKYRTILESIEEGYFEVDLSGDLTYVNDAMCKISGYTRKKLIGMNNREYTTPEMAKKMYDTFSEIFNTGKPAEIKDYEVEKNSKSMFLELSASLIKSPSGKAIGFGGIVRDITERKIADEALQESEARYRLLAENTTDIIWTMDMDLKISYISPSIEAVTGYTPEETQDMTLDELLTPESLLNIMKVLPQELENINKWMNDEMRSRTLEMEMNCKDNSTVWTEHTTSFMFNDDKNPIGVHGVSRDITKRRKAELELKLIMKELEHSNNELEQFAYVASHDLQEPLRMVASYLQLIEKRYKGKLDKDADEFIDFAVDGATRMKKMINDLLTFSRIQTRGHDFQKTTMDKIMKIVTSNLEVLIEDNNAKINYKSLPEIFGDETQLIQLFQNLIGNAIKFRGEKDPVIDISAVNKNKNLVFAIKDNGIGMTMEDTKYIFGIFQRLHSKGKYPGTGIGLSICKRIVERHRGEINVKSEEGKGSSFYISLPILEEKVNE